MSNNQKNLTEKSNFVLLNNDFKEENVKNLELEAKSTVTEAATNKKDI